MGAATSSFAVFYGISRVPGGIAADSVSPRIILALALLAAAGGHAGVNVDCHCAVGLQRVRAEGLCTSIAAVDPPCSFVQGFGWPAVSVVIKQRCPDPKSR